VYYGSNADVYGNCRLQIRKKEDNTGRKLRKEAGAARGVIPVRRVSLICDSPRGDIETGNCVVGKSDGERYVNPRGDTGW
jgi:hypothetical protein